MFYLFPLILWSSLTFTIGVSLLSPLLFSIWFSSFTAVLVYLIFSELNFNSGILLYFIEESLSLIIILAWFLFGGGSFLLFFLFTNSGLVPLHNWLVESINTVSVYTLVWGLTLHNIPLLFLFSSVVSSGLSNYFLTSFLWGVLVLFLLGDSRSLLIVSSSNTLIFVIFIFFFEWNSSILFFLIYILFFWSVWVWSLSLDSSIILFGLAGVPPFLLFQLNLEVFWNFLNGNEIFCLLLAGGSGVVSFVYLRFVIIFDFFTLRLSEISFLGFWFVTSMFLPVR